MQHLTCDYKIGQKKPPNNGMHEALARKRKKYDVVSSLVKRLFIGYYGFQINFSTMYGDSNIERVISVIAWSIRFFFGQIFH